jgi:hypothetical protein
VRGQRKISVASIILSKLLCRRNEVASKISRSRRAQRRDVILGIRYFILLLFANGAVADTIPSVEVANFLCDICEPNVSAFPLYDSWNGPSSMELPPDADHPHQCCADFVPHYDSINTNDHLNPLRDVVAVITQSRVAEYSGCRPDDRHVQFFWQTLREFSQEERSMFLKFTWGRTRLPLTADQFGQRFKLHRFSAPSGNTSHDKYLPSAQTCFFSISLPHYSSLEVMKEKLRYAIYNCQAIDGDETGTAMSAAAYLSDWEI